MLTRRLSLQGANKTDSTNAGLWLDKFIKGQYDKAQREDAENSKVFKQQLINEVVEIGTPSVYKEFYKRWEESLESLGTVRRTLKIEGRMIVGLGAESVLETSIALHQTYGVPFIAGSALKGLAASYAHRNLGAHWRKASKIAAIGKAHEFVFGSPDCAGFVQFHDALLIPHDGETVLHKDIITVHHQNYYGDTAAPPADWDSPIPVGFISASGSYLLALSTIEDETARKYLDFTIKHILEPALRDEGVGAKTSSGYGRGRIEKSAAEAAAENAVAEAKRQIASFVQRVDALPTNRVANEINAFYQEWKQSEASDDAKKIAAQSIIDKVRAAGRESNSKEKPWFQELLQAAKRN